MSNLLRMRGGALIFITPEPSNNVKYIYLHITYPLFQKIYAAYHYVPLQNKKDSSFPPIPLPYTHLFLTINVTIYYNRILQYYP